MNYSVLMSVYIKENPNYFRESLDSIFNQSVLTDDFVLVADGPLTEDLYKVISEFQEKYKDVINFVQLEKNVGLGQALNIGLNKCKNELIARMDSDDISMSDRCEKQIEAFEKNSKLDIVGTAVAEFSDNKDVIICIKNCPEGNEEIYKYSKLRSPFNHPTVMYKKSKVLEAGGYKHFLLFEDYYLWIRMLNNGITAANIQEPLLKMRAGDQMYNRRGGRKYLKQVISFRKYMYSIKYCNIFELLYAVIGQTFICIIPNKLRILIYKKYLRKNK